MENSPSDRSQTSVHAGVTFRPFREEADYERMLAILLDSAKADRDDWTPSLDEIKAWCARTARFDPARQLVFATTAGTPAGAEPLGVSRVSWYTGRNGARIYVQTSFLRPEWRKPGIWPALIREGDRRLREMAVGHPSLCERYFQGWATETQTEWIAALKAEGYEAVRHFRNMVYPLDAVAEPTLLDVEMPSSLEVRPVQAGDMRRIWEAQAEVTRGLFEYVAEQWTEEKYAGWLADTSHTPRLWQVAWSGDDVAGMVLGRVDEAANRGRERKRGYTEHVFVRHPWRRRGLAKALLARSLQQLREEGMDEAELGVDSENDCGAYGLYERLGYMTERTDIWFRKPLGAESASG